jgi:hypothetical protein
MMSFAPTNRRTSIVLILCSILLLLRIGGVHLHFCFDGQEPPASLHVLDGGSEHMGDGAGSLPHQDGNLDEASASILKSLAAVGDLPLLILAVLVPWLRASRPACPLPARRAPPPRRSPSILLPPLRGPPQTAA